MARAKLVVAGEKGVALAQQGRWEAALPLLLDAASAKVRNPQVFIHLGNTFKQVEAFGEAAAAYKKAARLLPTDPNPLLSSALAYKQAEIWDEAEATFQQLVSTFPDWFSGFNHYGNYLRARGNLKKATEILRHALTLKDLIETRNAYIMALCAAGDSETAISEGLKNLEAKHAAALARFGSTPAASVTLTDRNPPYDPRTSSRNVISFCLWGDNPVYVSGAIVNARIAPHIYRGWVCRFYCDSSVPSDALDMIRRAGSQVVMVTDPELQSIRPMWRFLVSDDPTVDRFVCRDTDSRLNGQELNAVDAWVKSGKRFHIMRDHIYHMEIILAGMWGAVAGVIPDMRGLLLRSRNHFDNRFGDQAFLAEQIWPLIKDDHCTHDSVYRFHGSDFPDAYRLPSTGHVGGATKTMPHWSEL